MNVNNCYFNSERPRWPKIALCEAEAECVHNVTIVNSKCGQECDPRKRGNALGIRQLLNSFYVIDRAFYIHEPDTPHDSSDDAIAAHPRCLSLKRIIKVPSASNPKKVWYKSVCLSHCTHMRELHVSERY